MTSSHGLRTEAEQANFLSMPAQASAFNGGERLADIAAEQRQARHA
jgi:hypothetical protein